MVSMALQGHINPMLKFAKHLVSKGVHVTIATTENGQTRMLRNTKPSSTNTNSKNPGIQLEFFSDGLTLEFDRSDTESLVNTIRVQGSKNLSTLITHLTKVNNYSCVIVNPFVPWAIDVAAEHGIPLLWIQACATYSIYYRHSKNTDPFPDLEVPYEKVHLPGLPMFEVKDVPSFILPSTPYYFRRLVRELFEAIDKVNCVLVLRFMKSRKRL
ncbi:hypothetical protein VNO78_26607 [Psophocarpus tetragonolobus]|uniref:Uncharacterized protein n=1 Tax=Psophocarpus tetragonolobus TaxID=3891 RepID=A0AAN9X8Q6_PSOTE